ncbi:NDR1/HIN1-like protein 10 [Senna tora]|uniref:NDR1/HIN1-like protein 10 n=1 Tax=Senna tora TaxID=362788 RepID=A0A834U2J6_9FABA|nr:NDR1/HIN1-like protein 10 [Senna tora]
MSTSYSSMLALPPPPSSPSSKQIIKPFSTNQIITSKEPRNHQIDTQSHSSPYPLTKKSSTSTTLLRQPRVRKTNPVVCASLSVVYFDPPQYFNGDFTLLTNFSNPNRRIDARFESGEMELFFSDRLISSQAVQGFALRRKETRVEAIGFISSLVFLPEDVGVKLQKQVPWDNPTMFTTYMARKLPNTIQHGDYYNPSFNLLTFLERQTNVQTNSPNWICMSTVKNWSLALQFLFFSEWSLD